MTDHDIDRLYQLPPGEFTGARNALAKARGTTGADIKALEKPTLPAWAVNQLYWHAREEWDALINASTALRHAHVQIISGRGADIAAAEAAHTKALRTAVATARRLAERTGEKITPATAEAIHDTLQALPSPDTPPGRLTKPLKPLGFGALMAMGIPVQGPTGSKVRQGPGSGKGPGSDRGLGSSGPGSRVREARKTATKALKAAETAEARAEAVLAEAKKAAAAAERELERLRDKLVFVEKQRTDTADTVRQRSRELQEAANARIQAAQDLKALDDEA